MEIPKNDMKLSMDFIDDIFEYVRDMPDSEYRDELMFKFSDFYLKHTKVVIDDILETVDNIL